MSLEIVIKLLIIWCAASFALGAVWCWVFCRYDQREQQAARDFNDWRYARALLCKSAGIP